LRREQGAGALGVAGPDETSANPPPAHSRRKLFLIEISKKQKKIDNYSL
jgi:hypothetical protein